MKNDDPDTKDPDEDLDDDLDEDLGERQPDACDLKECESCT